MEIEEMGTGGRKLLPGQRAGCNARVYGYLGHEFADVGLFVLYPSFGDQKWRILIRPQIYADHGNQGVSAG